MANNERQFADLISRIERLTNVFSDVAPALQSLGRQQRDVEESYDTIAGFAPEAIEGIRDVNSLSDRLRENLREVDDLMARADTFVGGSQRRQKALNEYAQVVTSLREEAREYQKIEEERNSFLQDQNGYYSEIDRQLEEKIQKEKELKELLASADEEQKEAHKNNLIAAQDEIEQLKEKKKISESYFNQKENESQDRLKTLQSTFDAMRGGSQAAESSVNKIFDALSSTMKANPNVKGDDGIFGALFSTKSLSESLNGFKTGFKSFFAGMNLARLGKNLVASIFTGFYNSTKEMVLQLDKASASTASVTGRQREYLQTINDTVPAVSSLGLSVAFTAKAFNSLYSTVADFSQLADKKSVLVMAAQLERLGVSADTTASLFDSLVSSLGMTFTEATRTAQELATVAKNIGLPVAETIKGFVSAQPILAAYGRKAVGVFEKVAAAAKATSLSTDKLLGITKQFDTFEGSAQAAGRLNAILGGPMLNASQLLLANEAERVKLLQDAMKFSGLEFENLSKFERLNLADALGISSVEDLNKLFRTGSEEISSYEAALSTLSVSSEDLENSARSAATLSEKFKAIWQSFAVAATPIVEMLNYLLDGLLSINAGMGGYFIPAMAAGVALLVAFATGFGPIVAGIMLVVGAIALVSTFMSRFKEEAKGLKIILGAIGIMAMSAFAPIILMAAPIVGIISYIVKNFDKLKKQVLEPLEPLFKSISKDLKEVGINMEGSGSGIMNILTSVGGFIVREFIPLLTGLIGIFAAMVKAITFVANAISSLFKTDPGEKGFLKTINDLFNKDFEGSVGMFVKGLDLAKEQIVKVILGPFYGALESISKLFGIPSITGTAGNTLSNSVTNAIMGSTNTTSSSNVSGGNTSVISGGNVSASNIVNKVRSGSSTINRATKSESSILKEVLGTFAPTLKIIMDGKELSSTLTDSIVKKINDDNGVNR